MGFEVQLSEESEIDLALILDHLIEAYCALGDPIADAVNQAAGRLRKIRDDIFSIGASPYQGTLSPDIAAGLRHVTKNRAIIYFDVDDARQTVRVIAVFFGGQDHQRHMLARLGKGYRDA
ncbi:type II toxin-antitoxin system RelE/ParE family toxin [Rhizobium paknamense]|uniref:Plasmid stabilization system protein ParE n=1 Tax=Rhizobium paknamense TaxID=1206817 RepID=A0ABU0IF67_9HYPH|nr:type II toxin-antitoxin system RelE/ParE family toxin [Rhizobium paknamense]MDQ0456352.1 plasmid stabilization system protein ParE [Rhizobium paknamense]